jgi:aspartate/methionine/tyrosine aminotransferase
MTRISNRVASISESMTMAITARAAELRSSGVDVISFGAGEPDVPTPEHIVDAAAVAARDPRLHHYSPVAGLPELREAIAGRATVTGHEIHADQVLVTNGAKHAIHNALTALIDLDDEVLIPAPYWVTYPEAVRLAGGRPVIVDAHGDQGFKVTVEQLDRATSRRTKALLFASPVNPTGVVYSPDEVAEIARWADRQGIWVISDEIYDRFVYSPSLFSSPAAFLPTLDRVVIINGASKTYAMTGWRVGWLIGPPDLVSACARLQSHTTSNVSNVAQAAALAAIEGDQGPIAQMREAFDRRRQTMLALLSEIPDVVCIRPEGAFYTFPSFEAVLGRPIGDRRPATTLEMAGALLDEAHVAVVPGEPFGAPGHLRFSYALGDDDLLEGLGRVRAAFSAD